jgi:hypothetical protein
MKFILCIHTIDVPEGVTLLEFEGAHQEEEQEQREEPEVSADEGVPEEELPECPDRRPLILSERQDPVHANPTFRYLSFEYSYLFIALSCRS